MILIKSKSFCQLTSPSPFIFQYMHLGLKGQANKAFFFFFKYKKGNSLQLPENSIQCYSLNLLIHIIIIDYISYLFQVAFKIESVAGKVCAHILFLAPTRGISLLIQICHSIHSKATGDFQKTALRYEPILS